MDDAALLRAWCDGDDAAGDQLLQSVFPRLYRFLFNKIGDDTGEVVQQTMLACVENRDQMRDCVNFDAYLLRMARNKLYDFLRKRHRSREELPGELPSVQAMGTSPASLMARQAREAQVLATLRSLPLDLQVVLELHYWSERSTQEIADVLELPVGTVKSRLRRAREQFEARLHRPEGAALLELLSSLRP
ncbi:MAG: RNA polymerase sigma factor [Myxococcales bacterium]|nr:RNA polymerase sigma factor [Myxococcales bacterium]